MKLNKKGNRLYLDNCWYMIAEGNGDYRVFNDGEYKGKYCGTIEQLEEMTEDEAFNYIFKAL